MGKEVYTSGEISAITNGECENKNILVNNFSSLAGASKDSVSFFLDPKYKEDLENTKAGLVILKKKNKHFRKGPSILVDDPYLAFAKVLRLFENKNQTTQIHNSAIIHDSVKKGTNLNIHPYVVIEKNTIIHSSVQIGSFSQIGNNVVIGKNTIIHSSVQIGDNVVIGDNCEIFSGAIIGADGFGYAMDEKSSWLKIPQIGSVFIGNNVDIGANTTIDRGTIDNTVIEDGVKIDNQVQIAHNCFVGTNSIIAGCTGIAGSAIIGKNCMIGGGALIKGHIKIADSTIISGGTGIGKTISVPGERYTNVFPYNLKHKDWLKIAAKLKNWIKNDK